MKLDNELLQTPLRILANSMDQDAFKTKTIPDLSKHPLALTAMRLAVADSCALLAIFDTAHRDFYVPCTGDSRAVAGVWEPSGGAKRQWRGEVLTEDQTGRNPSDLAGMRPQHSVDEADSVIRERRVLGGLESSPAFGDARYKWPLAVQETLNDAFMIGNGMPMTLQKFCNLVKHPPLSRLYLFLLPPRLRLPRRLQTSLLQLSLKCHSAILPQSPSTSPSPSHRP